MKKKFSILFSLICFLSISSAVHAYDMEVQCTSAKCAVSSHAPLFPPGVNWIPEKTVEKRIIIKNTEGSEKEVYLKIIPGDQSGSLDSYMNLTLAEENGPILWTGTLAELFALETLALKKVAVHHSFPLTMKASMDTQTPNTMQGASSTFDFGFGFTEQQTENTTSSNGSNSSGNHSANPNNTQDAATSQSNPVTAVLGTVTNLFNGANEASESSDGEEENVLLPAVLGTSDAQSMSCVTHPFWWVILVVETALLFATLKLRHQSGRISLQTLIPLVASLSIFLLVCNKTLSFSALGPALILLLPYVRRSSQVRFITTK